MNKEILVVDDDSLLLESMVKLLNREGYSVTAVENGYDALEEVTKKFFGIIILDIRMPGLGGVEVLGKIREIQGDIEQSNVIVVTGYASEDVPIEAIKLGAADYIMKPFETTEFLHSIEKNLKIVNLQREKEKHIKELENMNKKLLDANKELKELQEQVVCSERLAAIGKLASGVGHELRNPLASILNVSVYLHKHVKTDNEKITQFLDILSKEVDTANSIINELMDFSRARKLNKESISVKGFIEDTVKAVPLNDKISIVYDISSEVENVYVDPLKMRQVFSNILINALQAMPDGGELSIKFVGDVRNIKFVISDTGCGINKDIENKIFDPLFTTKAKGIGLGLAIANDIVKNHNGRIEVKSEEGKGSVFTIVLPNVILNVK